MASRSAAVEKVAGWLREAGPGSVTVLTGAGISTDSGIPDFRGPQGVWTRNPDAARWVRLDAYVGDAAVRREAWLARRDHPAWRARPNPGHRALVQLERSGRLQRLITQNVDGLHQNAGSDPARVIELHGNLYEVECLSCRARTAMAAALTRVAEGEPDPTCLACGGMLKAATVSFGQNVDLELLRQAAEAAAHCRLFWAVGSSLTVHPAAGLVEVAARSGARVVILNASPTPYDRWAEIVVREPLSRVLPGLVAA